MDFVHVDVEIACPGLHLAFDLVPEVSRTFLLLGGIVADALHHRNHKVLDLPLLVRLGLFEPVGHGEVPLFSRLALERHDFGAVVKGGRAAAIAQQHPRGVDVFSNYREVFRRLDYLRHGSSYLALVRIPSTFPLP